MRAVVAATLFANAFLVFVLQPHVSKRLLPVLGGSAEVWISARCSFNWRWSPGMRRRTRRGDCRCAWR